MKRGKENKTKQTATAAIDFNDWETSFWVHYSIDDDIIVAYTQTHTPILKLVHTSLINIRQLHQQIRQ